MFFSDFNAILFDQTDFWTSWRKSIPTSGGTLENWRYHCDRPLGSRKARFHREARPNADSNQPESMNHPYREK